MVGDGAMGTLLYHRGVALDRNFEHLNLVRPELVSGVHADYRAAGAQVLETNSFAANHTRLAAIGLESKVRTINLAAARLARQAASGDCFVAGAVGPLVQPRGQEAELTAEEKRQAFAEQMEALAEGGVDFFLLETFSCLSDLQTALGIGLRLGLPVIAQMAFLEGGLTRDGVAVEEAGRTLIAAGAAAVGANCGTGPREVLSAMRRLRAVTDAPLSAFANSGFPEYREGRYLYLGTPEYFAAQGLEMVRAGAALVGGCCGTTPEHIRALAERLSGEKPLALRISRAAPPEPATPAPAARPAKAAAGFLDGWGKRPVVTVELAPPKGLDCSRILEQAKRLRDAGVDAISLSENPLARIRMGNIALGHRIQQQTGAEVIVHVTCRDRNLIGLHSEMMGAHCLGIRNILAVTGDPVSVGGEAGASSVFDLNSLGLLQLLSGLNQGKSMMGADLGAASGFTLGAAFNPNLARMDGQLTRLEKKIAAGARFVQTQPVYDLAKMTEMLERTAPLKIPVLVGLLPLVSERNAEFLHNEVPGISLPDAVRARMRGKSGEAGLQEGLAITFELIEAARDLAGGFYLMPPFGKVELAIELLGRIRGKA